MKKLVINNVNMFPSFDSSINNYVLLAPYDLEKLDIEYTTNDEKNIVEIIGNEKLDAQKNEVILSVSNVDKTITREYNLIVLKDKKKQIIKMSITF